MIYGPWDMKCTRQNFFVILYHFLHHLEISFYTSVPGIMIIGYTVPEIWHVMDRIVIFYFGPATARKMKISKKWKKHVEVICTGVPKTMIICYTVPEIWHVADVIVIFPFGLFLALHTLTPQKMKKWKKTLEISSFNTSIPKIMIICFTFLRYMARNRCNFYFSFWAIFCPNSPKTKNFNKWKNHLEISSFYTCVAKQYIPTYIKYMFYEITGTGTSPEKLESLL